MNKWMNRLLTVSLISISSFSWADESLLDKVKSITDKAEPRAGMFFDQKDHTFHAYTAAQILTTDMNGFEIDGILGYSVDKAVLAGVETDLLNDLSRIPGVQLKIPWLKVYTGYNIGWSIENESISYGPSVDASVRW